MRKVALATLLCFGCATVRVPVSSSAEPADAPGTVAPPLLELWLESSEAVRPAEQTQAERQARAAIDAALAQHEIQAGALGAGDAVLFVRERGVALTEARRKQQLWAKVGLVAGIVVVVVVVVIAAVAGSNSKRSSSSSKPAAAPARPAPSAVAVKPPAGPAARSASPGLPGGAAAARATSSSPPRAGPIASAAPRAGPAAGAGRPIAHPVGPPPALAPLPPPRAYVYGYAPAPLFFDLQFYYASEPLVLRSEGSAPDLQPYPGAPPPPEDDTAAPPAWDAALPAASGDARSGPELAGDSSASGDAHSAPALTLPPLSPAADFAVEERGFFSGAQTSLQLDLLDRETGAVLWSKAVEGDADPLSAPEVSSLLDGALDGAAWARRAR